MKCLFELEDSDVQHQVQLSRNFQGLKIECYTSCRSLGPVAVVVKTFYIAALGWWWFPTCIHHHVWSCSASSCITYIHIKYIYNCLKHLNILSETPQRLSRAPNSLASPIIPPLALFIQFVQSHNINPGLLNSRNRRIIPQKSSHLEIRLVDYQKLQALNSCR